jgi:hypothetical protein
MATADVTMVSVGSSISPGTTQPAPAQFDTTQFIYPFQSLQSTPFTSIVPGAAVPPSVLNSHEADARANSERVPCFLLHLFMLLFSLVLFGLSWVVIFATMPLGLVALVTCIFAMYHFSSLRDMSVGCCCTPLGAYSWIFGMNVVLLVFAVPTLGVCIWITVIWSSINDDDYREYAYTIFFALSLTASVTTFATLVCSILAMIKLSALQRICTENWRPQPNFRVLLPVNSGSSVYPQAIFVPTEQEGVPPTVVGEIAGTPS